MRAYGEEAWLEVSSVACDLRYEFSEQRHAVREDVVPLYDVRNYNKWDRRKDESAERVGAKGGYGSVEVGVGDWGVRVCDDEGTAGLGDVAHVMIRKENSLVMKMRDGYVSAVCEALDNVWYPSVYLFLVCVES